MLRTIRTFELAKNIGSFVFKRHTSPKNHLFVQQAFSTMSKSSTRHGPRPLVVCGPSGSGKSTLLKKLFTEFPNTFGFSISHTTRKPRPGEENGVHYHFVEIEHMKRAIARGEFIETATFSGNMYGTSKQSIINVQEHGKVCVLDIDVEGVKQLKKSELKPLFVFIMPPSVDELKKRLIGRNTETEESLKKRLHAAEVEIEYGKTPGNFDEVVENHDVKQAYNDLKKFIISELETQKKHGIDVDLTHVNIE